MFGTSDYESVLDVLSSSDCLVKEFKRLARSLND
nr:MAG TPA: hypothetical protein [Caudoviricetes sp.]